MFFSITVVIYFNLVLDRGVRTMIDDIVIVPMNSLAEKLSEIRKDHSLVFLLFSDLHTNAVDALSTQILLDIIVSLRDEIDMDALIDLGDNLSMLGREQHISNDQVEETLRQLFDRVQEKANCPLFFINGNHDAVGTDFFKPALWNRVVKGIYDRGLAKWHSHGSYFYADYGQENLRIVFLSIPYDSDIEAVYPKPLWEFGSEQLQWLKQDALNTSHNIIIFTHVPFFYRYHGDQTALLGVWDGEKATQSYISDLCGWIDDVEEAASIIKASGKVIACFSGHTHQDSLWEPYERRGEDINPLPCHQIVTQKPIVYCEAEKYFDISLDILVWNPDDSQIRVLRVRDRVESFPKHNGITR